MKWFHISSGFGALPPAGESAYPPGATPLPMALRRPRPRTKPVKIGDRTHVTVQRVCNGCDRPLGDVLQAELDAGVRGLPLPDARPECPVCTPNPPGLVWTIELPYERPPLSMNGSQGDRRARARKVRAVRQTMQALARQERIPPLARLSAELHYEPRLKRTRDPGNLMATLKPLEDGLVDANLVPDDNPFYVEPATPVIDLPTGAAGRLYVVIRELPSVTGAGTR